MPNPSKLVACCELAAQRSISAGSCRGPSREWNLIRGGPTRSPRSCFNTQRWIHSVHDQAHDLASASSVVANEVQLANQDTPSRAANPRSSPKSETISDEQKAPAGLKISNSFQFGAGSSQTSCNIKFYKYRSRDDRGKELLKHFQTMRTERGLGYASRSIIPTRVKASISRASKSLKKQGRAISKEAFNHDVMIATSSMFPHQGIPKWWMTYFQDLFAKAKEGKLEAWQMPPRIDKFTDDIIDIIDKNDFQRFKAVWNTLERNVKAAQWPLIALWLLRNDMSKIFEFLLATYSEPYPPFGMVSDCMIFLSYYGKNIDRATFKEVVLTCMDPETWPVIDLTQRGVRLYVKTAGLENAYRAYEIMRSRESAVSAYTMLGFMNVFIQGGDVEKALECLRTIPAITAEATPMNSESVIRHCCKLLELDEVVEENGVRNFKILPLILELGVKPTVQMMNIVLSNAFATGDTHLGIDMLEYMKDQGMKFTSYTYMALLNDAVARSDRERVEVLLQEINSHVEFRHNKFIASKIFHAYFTFGIKNADWTRNPGPVFFEMLHLYARYYDLKPLRDLNITPQHYKVEFGTNTPPTDPVLIMMLAAHLRKCKRGEMTVVPTYRRFRELVDARHPLIAPLVQYSETFNEFILAFRYGQPDLADCVAIVEDMLNHNSEPFMMDGRLITPAKPTIWTWNTLMSVFVNHNLPDAVAKVRETMDKYGIKPDIVTWNTIINGRARAQDVTGTAEAMNEMDEDGFSPDQYTLKALRKIQEPEQLQLAIKKIDQEKEKLMALEDETLEHEFDELLDVSLKRIAGTTKA